METAPASALPGARRQQIRKHITLHNSQILVWREAVVGLGGFDPLHRERIFIRYIASNGAGSLGGFKGFGGSSAAESLIH